MNRRGHTPFALLALGFASLGACGGEEAPQIPGGGVVLRSSVTDPGQVVARVNGSPLLSTDLQAQTSKPARARGRATLRTGGEREVQAALKELIALDLLAQEAKRRGLDRDPQVLRTQRKAMASRLIREAFGDRFTRASIPAEEVEVAYKLNLARFSHPELVRVAHILVLASIQDSPAHHGRARSLAQKVRELASAGPLEEEAFKAIADQVREQERPAAGERSPLTIRAESLTTPLRGFTVEPFAEAAFALKQPGQISELVKTSFGYHVIYLKERIPARKTTLEQAEPEIRDKIFEEARRRAFLRWMDALMKRQRIETREEVMERLDQRAGRAS